jgi:Xaa-Pro aminopeptidase
MPCLFSHDEMQQRVAKLQARMAERGIGLALFDEMEALFWLSGYANSENRWRACLVPAKGEPFFVIRALDASALRDRTWLTDITTFRDWDDPVGAVADAIAVRGFGDATIGIDHYSYGMPLARYARLTAALPRARFVDIGRAAWELRLIKSAAEIAMLRRAAAIADKSIIAAVPVCQPGASQRDAVAAAMNCYLENGADPGPAGPITAGQGWDFLHRHTSDTPLARGDIVHLELTPRINGYSGRIMRCVVVGGATTEQHETAARIRSLQDAQIAAMRPGAPANEIDALLREPMLRDGLRPSFDNISGYTLGYYHFAGPHTSDFTRCFHPTADWRIDAGMVFHMYASAQGVSFSETIHVTSDGPERLTQTPRILFETNQP